MVGYDYGCRLNMTVKLKSFILFAILIGLISGCRAQQNSDAKEDLKPTADSIGGHWFLQPELPSDTATGHIPEIQFDTQASRFSGNTGCNRMSGSFLLTGDSLSFSNKMITTRMFCAGYNEAAFLKNLLRITHYKIKDGQLTLSANGVDVFIWNRKPPKQKKTGKA
jgi:heat shock protein HslJ